MSMKQNISINTDFKAGSGYPFTNFSDIADAGFTHIHWCHNWNTDFLYTDVEISEIRKQLDLHGLQLSDIHASSGYEKCWYSPVEYERIAGVELVKNRIYMSSILGGDAVVLHPFVVYEKTALPVYREQGLKSLKELENYAYSSGIKISLENLFQKDGSGINDTELENLDTLEYYFKIFSPDAVGFCWDTGHSIILGDESYEKCSVFAKERLSAMHLNDNKGDWDRHSAPFTWTDQWERTAEIIASSPYPAGKPLLLEVDINNNPAPVKDFLSETYKAGVKMSSLISKYRI